MVIIMTNQNSNIVFLSMTDTANENSGQKAIVADVKGNMLTLFTNLNTEDATQIRKFLTTDAADSVSILETARIEVVEMDGYVMEDAYSTVKRVLGEV